MSHECCGPSSAVASVHRAASLGAALLGIALLASGPLAGQDDRARFSQHLGAVYAARTLSVIEAGVRDGLPRGLLIDKAMEGVAKGMAPQVVLEAVDTFAGELRDALPVVGPRAEPIALEKAADALRRGVGRGLLTRLGRERAGDFPLLIVSIEELLDAGVELNLAEDLVGYAVSEGFDSDAVLRLPASVKLVVRECGGQAESCWSTATVRECARVMPTRACPTRALADAARSAAGLLLAHAGIERF